MLYLIISFFTVAWADAPQAVGQSQPVGSVKKEAPAVGVPEIPTGGIGQPRAEPSVKKTDPFDDLSFLDHLDDHNHPVSDEDTLSQDWDTHMQDFQADLMVTVQVAPNSQEFFFEDVTEVGIKLRGAFFVAPDKERKSGVDFWILNPKGEKVYQQANKGESIFAIKAEMAGTYSFVISNNKWIGSRQVTFIVGAGSRSTLKQEHLLTMDDRIKAADSSLREIQAEGSYLWIRQKSQLQAIEDVNSRVFWFTAVEFLVLVVVAVFQVYYIKGMLSYRRLY